MRRISLAGAALLAVCVALSLTAWAQSIGTNPAAPAVVAWEYKSFQHPVYSAEGLEAAMNELGSQGWEYAGAHQATVTQDDIPRPVTVYVFKRAKAGSGR